MIGIRIIKIFQLKDNENKKDDYVLFDSIDYAIKTMKSDVIFEVRTSLSTPLKFDIVLASIILTSS